MTGTVAGWHVNTLTIERAHIEQVMSAIMAQE